MSYKPVTEEDMDLLGLRLKLGRRHLAQRAFLSTGKPADKVRLLPSAQKLSALGVQIYATLGTSDFLAQHGVESTLVSKIHEHGARDVETYLREGLFDLVVNVLTDSDADEVSDARIIRELALKNRIPILTDPAYAIQMIEEFLLGVELDRQAASQPVDMWEQFLLRVRALGGFSDNHGHFDKSYLITPETQGLGGRHMQDKWTLYRNLKANYTHADLVARITRCVEFRKSCGVTHMRTMVDADTIVGLKCIEAALEVKRRYAGQVVLEVGIQPLEGVLADGARQVVEKACGLADFIGGLPSRDVVNKTGTAREHLGRLFSMAREMGKRVDVHVDQKGIPQEDETRLLARETARYHLEGRVAAVHAIFSRKTPKAQHAIAQMLHDVGVTVIVCPGAEVSMEQYPEKRVAMSNCLPPVPLLLAHGVSVVGGSDNTMDLFMPYSEGDPKYEAHLLMDGCRIYEDVVAEIMTNRSLFSTLPLAVAA